MASSSSELGWDTYVFLIIMLLGICVGVVPIVWGLFKNDNVLKHGVAATAKIISVTDTGRRHNHNPIVKITLAVTDASGKNFEAEVTKPVSPVYLPRYQPGATVPVKYDPKKPKNVAINREEANAEKR
jgi:hypothetical protein